MYASSVNNLAFIICSWWTCFWNCKTGACPRLHSFSSSTSPPRAHDATIILPRAFVPNKFIIHRASPTYFQLQYHAPAFFTGCFTFPCRASAHSQRQHAEAAHQDVRDGTLLHGAVAFMSASGTSQAKGQNRKRAAAAQQPHTLLVAVAPRLQRRQFKQTRRQLECQLRRRLQVMRARGSASEVGASRCRVQHKTHDVTDTALQSG